MDFSITIDLYNTDNVKYTDGTNVLILDATASVLRLLATQSEYSGDSRLYNGVPMDSIVRITEGSSYTVEYQTTYLPSTFLTTNGGTFKWQISTNAYKYYYNADTGAYVTVGSANNCVNKSAFLTFNGTSKPSSGQAENTIYKDGNNYCYYSGSTWYTLTYYNSTAESYIPKGTKITLIDMTDATAPSYYYYLCTEKKTTIDLDDFVQMGSETSMLSASNPAFKRLYEEKQTEKGQITERLLMVYDFNNAEWESTSQNFVGQLHLQHLYNGVDIMDYVRLAKTTDQYTRSMPEVSDYLMNFTETGMESGTAGFSAAAGDGGVIPNLGTAAMSVQWQEDTDYINSKLSEGKFAVKVELLDSNGNVKKFPEGMYFRCGDSIMKPDGDNKFAVIEVGEHAVKSGDAMTAEFRVVNPHYDLRKYLGTDTATFRLSLYNSADDQYVKLGDLSLSAEISFTITDRATYTLKAECQGSVVSRVLDGGESLKPTITASSTLDTTEKVKVQLTKKIGGTYSDIEWTDVFETDVTEVTAGTYDWEVKEGADSGIYRIVFTYGNRIENLSFIVK